MEQTTKARPVKQLLARVLLLLAGLCIAHLGVTIFILTSLGSDPFNVFIQGIWRSLPLSVTHGTVHLSISLLILLVLLKADRSKVGIGTLLCMALGGPIIDVYTLFLSPVIHEALPLWVRMILLVLGCAILAFGMTIVISSQAGTGPNDLVAVVISEKLGKPFGIIRVLVDLCFTGIGFALGGTVGVGTVICAFLVGPVAQVFFPISRRICDGTVKRIAG